MFLFLALTQIAVAPGSTLRMTRRATERKFIRRAQQCALCDRQWDILAGGTFAENTPRAIGTFISSFWHGAPFGRRVDSCIYSLESS